jgi:hypothetical protein
MNYTALTVKLFVSIYSSVCAYVSVSGVLRRALRLGRTHDQNEFGVPKPERAPFLVEYFFSSL